MLSVLADGLLAERDETMGLNCGECLMREAEMVALVDDKCPKCGTDYSDPSTHPFVADPNWGDTCKRCGNSEAAHVADDRSVAHGR